MYKHFTKDDWVKMLPLPSNYHVDFILISGTYDKERELNRLLNVLGNLKIEHALETIEDKFFSRINPILIGGTRIWFDISYGGAYLSEMLHIGCLFGSKSNILLGSCGGLKKGLKPLDLILPTYSYGNESTTRVYAPDAKDNKHYSDESLNKGIKGNIKKEIQVYTGPTVTCQAMLGETEGDINSWSKEGYLGVEMESSTLFAVSNHFKVPSAALLHISDNLIDGDYVGSDNYNQLKQNREELIIEKYKITLKTILNN